jgi:Archaeal/vacuolar-type H+-ATPase subunit C
LNLISARYAFSSAYLKGEEAGVISAGHVDEMLQKSTTQDVLEAIRGTDIGGYLREQPVKIFDDADQYLWRYLGECMKRLRLLNPPSDIIRLADLYMEKYDVLNTKISLRQVLAGKTAPMAPLGIIYDQGYLDELSDVKSADGIIDVLVKCSLIDYASIIEDIKEIDIGSMPKWEAGLGRMYYARLTGRMAKMGDSRVSIKTLGIMIDFINLQAVFRSVLPGKEAPAGKSALDGGHMLSGRIVKELFSLKPAEIAAGLEHTEYHQMALEILKSYEKEGNITAIDRTIDKHRFRLLNELLSPRILTSLNIFWYLILKELEIRNVRLILKALADGIPLSEIKDYLVIAP